MLTFLSPGFHAVVYRQKRVMYKMVYYSRMKRLDANPRRSATWYGHVLLACVLLCCPLTLAENGKEVHSRSLAVESRSRAGTPVSLQAAASPVTGSSGVKASPVWEPNKPAPPASAGSQGKPTPGFAGPFKVAAPLPGERPLLRLEGAQGAVTLTRSQLASLPRAQLVTTHAQLGTTSRYEGVLLRTLARAMNVSGQDLRLYASNGFVSTIRAADYMTAPILLADTVNGNRISVLEKGPLTVVLPSQDARFRNRPDYWVWFVNRITPVP